jgi:4,5-dihydroxyphthalate decarboxylase
VTELELTLAVGRYAITEALLDGSVRPQGVTFRALTMPSPERHWRMLRHQEFDVCELSLAGYTKAFGRDPGGWSALPVFPHRRYRHGYVFTSSDSQVRSPADLTGAAVGLRTWGTTAGLWIRGMLQDEYGLDLRTNRWVTESAESAGPPGGGFVLEPAPADGSLADLLRAGQLQAVIYPERLHGAGIRCLFEDPEGEERAYARRTNLFPIMHLVAVRRELLEAHPWLANELVTAFEHAKQAAYRRAANPRWLPLAWGEQALAEQRELLGDDPWLYGLADNLFTLETALRYCHEQGLLERPVAAADLFWPSTRDRPPTYSSAR